jgi:hypothetical protein
VKQQAYTGRPRQTAASNRDHEATTRDEVLDNYTLITWLPSPLLVVLSTGVGELGDSRLDEDIVGVGSGGLKSKLNLSVDERVAMEEEAKGRLSSGT